MTLQRPEHFASIEMFINAADHGNRSSVFKAKFGWGKKRQALNIMAATQDIHTESIAIESGATFEGTISCKGVLSGG